EADSDCPVWRSAAASASLSPPSGTSSSPPRSTTTTTARSREDRGMRSRCEYLTARCPDGCEVWLHPRAVGPHVERCPGPRWTGTRMPVTHVALSDQQADLARLMCPPTQLRRPTFSGDRLLSPHPGMRLHDSFVAGVVVESPIPGVTGRRC